MSEHQPRLPAGVSRRNLLIGGGLAVAGIPLGLYALSRCAAHQNPESQAPFVSEMPLTSTSLVGTESASPSPSRSGKFSEQAVWLQDFTALRDGPIDKAVWNYDIDPATPGKGREQQAYTNRGQNVGIRGGQLVIQGLVEDYRYPNDPQDQLYKYTSARINTKDKFSFVYGKIEASMRMPKGRGTWPAFWLLSNDRPHTKSNAQSPERNSKFAYMVDGEIDILEYYGNMPGRVEANVHTVTLLEQKENQKLESGKKRLAVPDCSDSFHDYGIELTPDGITWTFDGQPYHSFAKPSDRVGDWPFGGTNRLYPILNLALGGNGGGQVDPSQASGWQLAVQNISYYSYNG